jgi:hypothetical protein
MAHITDRQNALRAPQEVEQDLATLVNWTNEHVSDDDHQYPHRPDLMTLDDITEINRLTELIDNILRGNPPSYYIVLREDEVHNIRRVMIRRLNNSPSHEAFYTKDTGGNELEQIFGTNQIKLIRAKINSIRGAALAGRRQRQHRRWAGRSRGVRVRVKGYRKRLRVRVRVKTKS